MLMLQKTIKKTTSVKGVSLHSGKIATIELIPASVGTGIVFLCNGKQIKATWDNVVDTSMATTLGDGVLKIATVEHLLSAVAGLEISNLFVSVDGPEIPIMDGSAASFIYMIQEAGIRSQGVPRKTIRIKSKIDVKEDGRWAAFVPCNHKRITYAISFSHPKIGFQKLSLRVSRQKYVKEISRARTFGFLRDMEYLKAHNLALGGSLDNAIVLDDYRIMNEDGLRYPDEFVRHKMLDAVGDVSLAGVDVIGHYIAYKSGHTLNNRLLKKLFSTEKSWEWASVPEHEKIEVIGNAAEAF